MKKTLFNLALILMALSFSWAETQISYMPSYGWYNPRILGMGGEVSADPDGFSSFVSNPAGFVGDKKVDKETGEVGTKKEFTLFSLQAAMIANPFQAVDMAGSMEDGQDSMSAFVDFALAQLEENGMGARTDLAVASYAGGGWGIGTFISAGTMFPQSDLALATEGELTVDGVFEIGYAREFELPLFDLTVGGDLRPMYRMLVPLTADQLLDGIPDTSALPATYGFGIGFDGGATLEWREMTAALALRDIGHTKYMMYEAPLADVGNFSSGAASDIQYTTPMSLTVGFGYEPELPRIGWLVDMSFVASYKHDLLIGLDPLSYYGYTQSSFYKSLHMGVETKWIDLIYLRAGLNGGYFTAGTGIDFVIGELNMAVFSTETGRTAGQTSEMGASMELAFRW